MIEIPLIPTYRDVEIPDGDAHFDELARLIAATTASGWTHDPSKEKSPLLSDHRWCVMVREDGPGRPGLAVFLTTKPGVAYVPNIVPTAKHELSYAEYNAAAFEFATTFATPAAQTLGLRVDVGDEVIDIRNDYPPEVAAALLTFSRTSNRATGSGHPSDRERWFEFITLVHNSRADLSATDLGIWLELDGWDERMASDLVIEFEFALGLLRYVDGH